MKLGAGSLPGKSRILIQPFDPGILLRTNTAQTISFLKITTSCRQFKIGHDGVFLPQKVGKSYNQQDALECAQMCLGHPLWPLHSLNHSAPKPLQNWLLSVLPVSPATCSERPSLTPDLERVPVSSTLPFTASPPAGTLAFCIIFHPLPPPTGTQPPREQELI